MMDCQKKSKPEQEQDLLSFLFHVFILLFKAWHLHYPQGNQTTASSAVDLDVMLVAANVATSCYLQAEMRNVLQRSGKLTSF